MKYLRLAAIVFGLVGCGGPESPPNETQYVVSGYDMNLYTLFTCVKEASADDSLGAELGLENDLKIVYTVLFGSRLGLFEKVVGAQIIKAEGVTTAGFDLKVSSYKLDPSKTSSVSISADVNSDNGDGIFSFKVEDDVASFSYVDSDLAQPVTYTFTDSEASRDCSGAVLSDPAA